MAKRSKNKDNISNPSVEATAAEAEKKKKKRKKKKHPVLFTFFLFFFCIFVAGMLTALIVGGTVLTHVDSVVNKGVQIDLDTYKSTQSQTTIMYAYDEDGTAMELKRLHGEENRIWIDYDEIPEYLKWGFVCLEDARFWTHPGVDWIRTIGVLIVSEYEGQGGSTITQQLIKNLTDDNEATFIRKFNEILRALNLEKNYSKKDILEAYLNTVSLGAGCYGVKTAAETYFGKELSELTLSECATIAGITKAPYSLNPYVDYEACMERRDDCLYYMHYHGKITDKEYQAALKEKIVVQDYEYVQEEEEEIEEGELLSWYEEYVIDQVIADLQKKYGYEYNEAWRQVYYGGLNIYAAVDLEMQNYLERVFRDREGFPDSYTDSEGNLPQCSMTIVDYQGRIVALVGGTGEKTDNRVYNRATDERAKRQPGSSIKPLAVYAPAVDLGLLTPSSTVLEKAIEINGEEWPQNFNGDNGSGKYITVRSALAQSLNTVPARILNEMLGLKTAYNYCNDKFHINLTEDDMTLSSFAVGGTSTGVTTLEMAAAFATFGNGGRYYKPHSYYQVTDRNGNILLDMSDYEPQQSIKPETAESLLSMMTSAVTDGEGTGYGSQIDGFQTFAKTGTTSDNCDKWYCGGTPYYATAVWYGYDYREDMYTGTSNPAKTVFYEVFSSIHEDLEEREFEEVVEMVDQSIAEAEEFDW